MMRKITPDKDEYMTHEMSGPMKKKESKPRYPVIRIDLKHIPEAKKWEVSESGTDKGKEYEITLKVKMIGLSQSRFDNSAEFEMREIETEEIGKGDDKEEQGKEE